MTRSTALPWEMTGKGVRLQKRLMAGEGGGVSEPGGDEDDDSDVGHLFSNRGGSQAGVRKRAADERQEMNSARAKKAKQRKEQRQKRKEALSPADSGAGSPWPSPAPGDDALLVDALTAQTKQEHKATKLEALKTLLSVLEAGSVEHGEVVAEIKKVAFGKN